jgi:glycosyltransferase involved in cell wall biosynthesis
MHVAFVEIGNPRDPLVYSGITSRILEEMEKITKVTVIAPLDQHSKFLFVFHKLILRLLGLRFIADREKAVLKSYARQIRRQIPRDADVIFSSSSVPVSYLEDQRPIIFWPDVTLPALKGYYSSFDHLSNRTMDAGRNQEINALARATGVFYCSEWSADFARKLSPENAHKIHVLNYGANVDSNLTEQKIRTLIERRSKGEWRMLFVGIDPKRKGLDTAVEVARVLNERGHKTILYVVGNNGIPSNERMPPYVHSEGILPRDSSRMRELFEGSSLFILPTRADCCPIVLCEAASFGLPVISRRTGGTPSIIESGTMGLLFDVEAPPNLYADAIAALLTNPVRYQKMSLAAFQGYRERLNWPSQVGKLVRFMQEFVERCHEVRG